MRDCQVRFEPYVLDNRTVLSGKCDPGWWLVGDTCYVYVGVPMNFSEARHFCKRDNASLPYLMNNYHGVVEFLASQQLGYDIYTRVWQVFWLLSKRGPQLVGRDPSWWLVITSHLPGKEFLQACSWVVTPHGVEPVPNVWVVTPQVAPYN